MAIFPLSNFCLKSVALDLTIYLAPVKSPFPGERGQGDRGSELEVCFYKIEWIPYHYKNALLALRPQSQGSKTNRAFI
ncbi:hypothetical protein PNE09_03420 [[Eubacterium] siraeum]|uniref:Uncharacterized protein n=1 Tax=[Eubacterium] siraeum TaxID=39492 RepID=A0AAW6CXJ5_9FIRM|nr:hypothetical protein [[Eubacterium] siraeum]